MPLPAANRKDRLGSQAETEAAAGASADLDAHDDRPAKPPAVRRREHAPAPREQLAPVRDEARQNLPLPDEEHGEAPARERLGDVAAVPDRDFQKAGPARVADAEAGDDEPADATAPR